MQKYFQSVRDNLVEDGTVYQATTGVAETLNESGISYPFMQSEDNVQMDSITASNGQLLWKEMNKLGKKLSSKLHNNVQAESSRFVLHHSFKITGVGKGENHKYIPFTLTMDDGQTLTALAKNVQNLKAFNPKKDLEITHWFINKKDATGAIYKLGDRDIDSATTIARLVKLIEGVHVKFVKNNPDALGSSKEIKALKGEINAMTLDLSDVVFEQDKSYKEKLEDLEDRRNPKVVGFVRSILNAPHTISEDGETLTAEDGKKYAITYDYHGEEGIVDLVLLGTEEEVQKAKELAQQEVDSGEFRAFAINKEAMKLIEGNKVGEGTNIMTAYNEVLEEGRSKLADEALEKATYTITLPQGAENYINFIKNSFEVDDKLKDISYSFIVGGVTMDAIDKKEVKIEGGESNIRTLIKQTIHFATIGADKIEGKNSRMPSVALIRNAEYIREKTGVDYTVDHHQHATFQTAREEFQTGDEGKGHNLLRPIGKYEAWSVKERWLGSGFSRKKIVEYILKALEKEAKTEDKTISKTETVATEETNTKAKLEAIKEFMGDAQYSILRKAIQNADHEFKDVIDGLYKTITTMPKTYEQDGKGDKAVAYLHYFNSGSDWYITEKDMGDEQIQAFGLVSLNGDYPELGYINIQELAKLDIELDFYFDPITIGEAKAKLSGETVDDEPQETEVGEPASTEDEPKKPKYPQPKEPFIKDVVSSASTIIGIDKGTVKGYDRSLFVSSISNKVKTQHKNGNYEIVNNTLDWIEAMNEVLTKDIITKRSGIWKLRTEEVPETSEPKDTDFSLEISATTADEFEQKLDELAEKLEELGQIDQYEDELNALADKLTELMKSENE